MVNLWGWEIKRKSEEVQNRLPSFAPIGDTDGAVDLASGGGVFGSYTNYDAVIGSEAELIQKYRDLVSYPVVDKAVQNIVNDAIVKGDDKEDPIVKINLDAINNAMLPAKIKQLVQEEFEFILDKLEFNQYGYEIFKKWYVDGRIYYHLIIDEKKPEDGIQSVQYIDSLKIRKVREKKRQKVKRDGIDVYLPPKEYYVYNENGLKNRGAEVAGQPSNMTAGMVKIAKDSIAHVTSGLTNADETMVLSYLHKAIRPTNITKAMEDSLVIYRVTRAPERLIFYIDVGSLPKMKAEQYLKDMMAKFKNKVVYDSSSGQIRHDTRQIAMNENFWIPRREGGKGTEIDTLAGGQNLGEIADLEYFQKLLFAALDVPITRLESQTGYNIGRSSEITRDEINFAKFIDRLRSKFSELFLKILERQLLLKKIMNSEEWEQIRTDINFIFNKDNHFEELKNIEIMRERMEILAAVDPSGDYVGRYYSHEWVRVNILRQTEDEMEEIDEQIEAEKEIEQYDPPEPEEVPAPAPAPAPQPEPEEPTHV